MPGPMSTGVAAEEGWRKRKKAGSSLFRAGVTCGLVPARTYGNPFFSCAICAKLWILFLIFNTPLFACTVLVGEWLFNPTP